MIFEPFEWPLTTENLTLDVDLDTWKVLRSSKEALRGPYTRKRGFWCKINGKPFYLYKDKEEIVIHFNGKTTRIPEGSDEYQVKKWNFFFWSWFVLEKKSEVIISCVYRDYGTTFYSIVAALAFDDDYRQNPFDLIVNHLK